MAQANLPQPGPQPTYYTFKNEVPLDVQTRPGVQSTLAFQAGRGYYAKPGGPAGHAQPQNAGPPQDPFAALSEQQITQRANAEIQPGLAAALAAIQKQGAASQSAIRGYTQAEQQALAPYPGMARANYSAAESGQAHLDDAIAQSLSGGGASEAASLHDMLTRAALPSQTVDQASGVASALGNSAATTARAKGSAQLGALIAQGAGSADYFQKLPGIAGLEGLQQAGNATAQSSKAANDAHTAAMGQLPGILSHLHDQELSKATARESGLFDKYKAEQQAAESKRTADERAQHDRATEQATADRIGVSRDTLRERAHHDGITEAQAAKRIAQEHKIAAERARHDRATEKTAAARAKAAAKKKAGKYGNDPTMPGG